MSFFEKAVEQIYTLVCDLCIPTDFFIFLPTIATGGTRTCADIYTSGTDGSVEEEEGEKIKYFYNI